MVSMACPFLCSKALSVSAYSIKSSSRHNCHTLTLYSQRVDRVASFTARQGPSLVVLDVKQVNIADPNASSATKGGGRASGNNSSAAVSSSQGLNFLSIISSWNVLLTGAAVLLSVPIYRRMARVEVILEEAEKRAEKAKETIEKVAEEAEEIQGEAANMSDEQAMNDLASKLEYIAETIEQNSQKAQEVLKKVEHVKMEVDELLEEEEERSNSGEGNRKW